MKNVRSLPVQHYMDGERMVKDESIAVETLIQIVVNGHTLVNLLGSPEHTEALAIGHLMTQHDVDAKDISSVKSHVRGNVVEVDVVTRSGNILAQRHGIVTASCGACDQENLDELTKAVPAVPSPERALNLESVLSMLHELREHQAGFQATGGMHAAGLHGLDGGHVVMEDIGRHNAVDKAYGTWHKQNDVPADVLVLSGRCGWDIVAKAAVMGTPIIASFGAASSLAAETARASNMTLVSFVKKRKAVIIGPFEGRFQRKH